MKIGDKVRLAYDARPLRPCIEIGTGIIIKITATMTAIEHAELAMHRLVMARIAMNARAVQYWLCRVDYWSEIIIQEDRRWIT